MKDVTAADRVMAIVATLGKAVNLLRVDVPPAETQILLKVRFANVDRAAATRTWVSISLRARSIKSTAIGTGQYTASHAWIPAAHVSLSDALNVLLVPARHQPGRHHAGAGEQAAAGDAGRAERA